jgi:5,10-methylenetetrahydromethanopterin reductase
VLKDGEAYDSPRMKAETGPFAVMMLHNAMEAQDHGDLVESAAPDNEIARLAPEYRKTVYEKYQPAETRYLNLHRGHLMFVRPEEERFATAELIRTATVSGTVAELRERMRRLRDAGYDEVVVQITPGHDTMVEDWARVFEGV